MNRTTMNRNQILKLKRGDNMGKIIGVTLFVGLAMGLIMVTVIGPFIRDQIPRD